MQFPLNKRIFGLLLLIKSKPASPKREQRESELKSKTMRYLSLLIACIGTAFTSCKKCGHCDTSYGNGRETFCGDDYENAKKACEQSGFSWMDE